MTNPLAADTAAPDAPLNDRDLDQVSGGLLPAVAPQPAVGGGVQPLVPAVQRGLIGLL